MSVEELIVELGRFPAEYDVMMLLEGGWSTGDVGKLSVGEWLGKPVVILDEADYNN